MYKNILIIHSSGRQTESITRRLTGEVLARIKQQHPAVKVTERDLVHGLPFVNEKWIGANFTAADERTHQQSEALQESDQLVAEIQRADWVIIGSPIYNFSVPAVLKAWIDQVARAQLTFRYTAAGPEGLLKHKKAILVMASGGVPIGSDMDFGTPYLQQVMGFLGIDDVTVLDANHHEAEQLEQLMDHLTAANETHHQETHNG
ncbi:FMN-dependent NADH-azoreductase [Marinicella sediminis]|uniref:FMN dependent NADH:quinone oxidoreductase n=1 Tax=Marinicella sediminis TaxID=1792834 RepID=A0ABV7JFQ0_9GAMM|nr:NAD(P)H-dependent oxidoreductase [Marinicella sediminis]